MMDYTYSKYRCSKFFEVIRSIFLSSNFNDDILPNVTGYFCDPVFTIMFFFIGIALTSAYRFEIVLPNIVA